MGFSASAPTGFQGHHLIPDGLKGHRVLDALGSFFNIDDESLNRINLPDSGHAQSARASGLALSDSVPHSGRHTAYTNFVTELLDGIGGEFLEEDGSLKSSKTVADLDREVKRLQYFLADGLTPSLAPGGHSVRDPWIFLNNADPRLGRYYSSTELLTKMQQHVPNYDALRANEGNLFEAFARGDELIDKIDFQSLSEPLDGEKGNSGLSALIKKAEGYKAL
ncbi:MAG: AHH domain-containing protein, partial [Novosphingobium sp.]